MKPARSSGGQGSLFFDRVGVKNRKRTDSLGTKANNVGERSRPTDSHGQRWVRKGEKSWIGPGKKKHQQEKLRGSNGASKAREKGAGGKKGGRATTDVFCKMSQSETLREKSTGEDKKQIKE